MFEAQLNRVAKYLLNKQTRNADRVSRRDGVCERNPEFYIMIVIIVVALVIVSYIVLPAAPAVVYQAAGFATYGYL